MNWLKKIGESDKVRVQNNIERLVALRKYVKELGDVGPLCQSAAHSSLEQLLGEKIVQGRPRVSQILSTAVNGENNQKVALDAPMRFRTILYQAADAIDREIEGEKRELTKINRSISEKG